MYKAIAAAALLLVQFQLQLQRQITGCPTGSSAAPSQPLTANDFVELERPPCFGPCPIYTVRIYADGRVEWEEGIRGVTHAGVERSSVDSAKARALIEKYRANGFWGLCSSYSVGVEDASTVFTTVHIADREKRVSNYYSSAPSWFQDLELEIDELADTYRRVHGEWQSALFAFAASPRANIGSRVRPVLKPSIDNVRLLLNAGADINAQDKNGQTALMFAANQLFVETDAPILARLELIAFMRKAGAKVDLRDSWGASVADQFDEQTQRVGSGWSILNYDGIRRAFHDNVETSNVAVKVSGRVKSPVPGASITLERMGTGIGPLTVVLGAGGIFVFPSVLPGIYVARSSTKSDFPVPTVGVTVGSKDIVDMEITMPVLRDVVVRTTVEGGAAKPEFALFLAGIRSGPAIGPVPRPAQAGQSPLPPNIKALLDGNGRNTALSMVRISDNAAVRVIQEAGLRSAFPLFSTWSDEITTARSQADGSSVMTLPDGEYAIAFLRPNNVRVFPGSYAVKSFTQGSRNLLNEPLKIDGSAPAEIEIVLTPQ